MSSAAEFPEITYSGVHMIEVFAGYFREAGISHADPLLRRLISNLNVSIWRVKPLL